MLSVGADGRVSGQAEAAVLHEREGSRGRESSGGHFAFETKAVAAFLQDGW